MKNEDFQKGAHPISACVKTPAPVPASPSNPKKQPCETSTTQSITTESTVVTSNRNKRIITPPSPSIMKKLYKGAERLPSADEGVGYKGNSEGLNGSDDLRQVVKSISMEKEEAKRSGRSSRKKGQKHHPSALDRVGYKKESESLHGSNDVSSTEKSNSVEKGGKRRSSREDKIVKNVSRFQEKGFRGVVTYEKSGIEDQRSKMGREHQGQIGNSKISPLSKTTLNHYWR